MTSHARARSRLLAERASLRCLLTGLDYDPSANGRDEGDMAMANERREWLSREHDRALTRIGDIDVALARIGAGVYDTCDACTRPITAARLRALPAVTTCIECAQRSEREADDARFRRAVVVEDE